MDRTSIGMKESVSVDGDENSVCQGCGKVQDLDRGMTAQRLVRRRLPNKNLEGARRRSTTKTLWPIKV